MRVGHAGREDLVAILGDVDEVIGEFPELFTQVVDRCEVAKTLLFYSAKLQNRRKGEVLLI